MGGGALVAATAAAAAGAVVEAGTLRPVVVTDVSCHLFFIGFVVRLRRR
jgi:hypothetical protein